MQSSSQKPKDRRAKIIQAATRHFAKSGFDGASTRRIAEEVKVAQSLLLYYFETKDDLWKAVMDDCFRRAEASSNFKLDENQWSAREQLLGFIRVFTTFCSQDADLHRLMTLAGRTNDHRLQWLVEKHLRPVFERTKALIEQGQRENWIRGGDPTLLYYSILAVAGTTYAVAPEIELLDPDTKALDISEVEQLITSILFID